MVRFLTVLLILLPTFPAFATSVCPEVAITVESRTALFQAVEVLIGEYAYNDIESLYVCGGGREGQVWKSARITYKPHLKIGRVGEYYRLHCKTEGSSIQWQCRNPTVSKTLYYQDRAIPLGNGVEEDIAMSVLAFMAEITHDDFVDFNHPGFAGVDLSPLRQVRAISYSFVFDGVKGIEVATDTAHSPGNEIRIRHVWLNQWHCAGCKYEVLDWGY